MSEHGEELTQPAEGAGPVNPDTDDWEPGDLSGGPRKRNTLREWSEALIVAAILAMILRSFIIQAYKIPSGSMIPTLLIGDHLFVSKLSYHVRMPFSNKVLLELDEPERGDIIVFNYPEDPSENYVKRLIGLPGDEIYIRGREVYVNGDKLDEAYAFYDEEAGMRFDIGRIKVPEDHFFMLGDNRDHSRDSRYWGFVPRNLLIGRALFIYFSWDHESTMPRFSRFLTYFPRPDYGSADDDEEASDSALPGLDHLTPSPATASAATRAHDEMPRALTAAQ